MITAVPGSLLEEADQPGVTGMGKVGQLSKSSATATMAKMSTP